MQTQNVLQFVERTEATLVEGLVPQAAEGLRDAWSWRPSSHAARMYLTVSLARPAGRGRGGHLAWRYDHRVPPAGRTPARCGIARVRLHADPADMLTREAAVAEPGTGPAVAGYHHFAPTVSDVEASAQWYERVFGMTRVPVAFPHHGGE